MPSRSDNPHAWHGRRYSPDKRDLKHLMPLRAAAAKAVTRKTWFVPQPPLNQGPTQMCVGFSCFAYLVAAPVRSKPPFTPAALYDGAKRHDEWPGENYDGSSVRGGFQFLHLLGFIKNYQWAFDNIEPIVNHLLTVGPVVVGTDWYKRMDKTDADGYIWPEGGAPTGHAYLLNAADREKKNPDGTRGRVGIVQSWGAGWGFKGTGRAFLTFQAFEHLLKAQGEAAVAVEVKA